MRMRTVAAGNTAVGYVRVSTQEQAAEGISLDAQEARIRAYCTMRRLDLVDVVVDAGVSLHLIDMGGASLDTSSAMGRMFLTMAAGFAEMERNLTAERTAAALSRKAEKGERIGELPYGKMLAPDGVHLLDHPAEQAVIATVRELRRAGLSTRCIAAELNHRGLTNRAGGAFQHTQVCRILAGAHAA